MLHVSITNKVRDSLVVVLTIFLIVLILRFAQEFTVLHDSFPHPSADLRLVLERWAIVRRQHVDDEAPNMNPTVGTAEIAEGRVRRVQQLQERKQVSVLSLTTPARLLPYSIPLILHQYTRDERALPLAHAFCVLQVLLAQPMWKPHTDTSQPDTAQPADCFATQSPSGVACESPREQSNKTLAYWLWSDRSTRDYVIDGWSRPHGDPSKRYFDAFRNLKSHTQTAHALRYLTMYEFGGMFLDMDLQPGRQSLVQIIHRGYPCALLDERSVKSESTTRESGRHAACSVRRVSNAVLMCRPQHPFFKLVLDSLARLLDEIQHESDSAADADGDPVDNQQERENAESQCPFTDEEQIRRALRQGHGTDGRLLSWAVERYWSSHPALSSQCLADPTASPDCVHIAVSSPLSSTRLSFERCSNKYPETGEGRGPPLPLMHGLAAASSRALIQHAAVRRGFGHVESVGIGATYSIGSLLSGYCTYIRHKGVYHMESICFQM